MSTVCTPEKYLSAKELSAAFAELNIRPNEVKAMRLLIRECPASLMRMIRFSDACKYLRERPDWKPYVKRRNSPTISVL